MTEDAVKKLKFPPADDQLRILRRGAADIIVEAELRRKLERARSTERPLIVKLGLDPTAPDLHLGHTVVLGKLRDFQDLGHQVVVVIGDFTGMIGDPTGRSETRKPLTDDQIRDNAETYRAQLGKVLDMARVRVELNSTWLGALRFEDLIRVTAHLTVAQMLQREDFAARYTTGRPISLHEFLYPVAQAYDSVFLRADVELGGTDQTFNLLVGRDLQRASGHEPQIAFTVPILEGLDGVQKMSKSLGNYVGINEPPDDMFGKLMSVPDALMWRYFELLTRLDEGEMATLRAGHPMDAKKQLASILTETYHGKAAAEAALDRFIRIFQQRRQPEAVDVVEVDTAALGARAAAEPVALLRVLRAAGLVASSAEGRRLIQQGAVDVDGQRVSDVNARMTLGEHLVRVGKHAFKRVVLRGGGL